MGPIHIGILVLIHFITLCFFSKKKVMGQDENPTRTEESRCTSNPVEDCAFNQPLSDWKGQIFPSTSNWVIFDNIDVMPALFCRDRECSPQKLRHIRRHNEVYNYLIAYSDIYSKMEGYYYESWLLRRFDVYVENTDKGHNNFDLIEINEKGVKKNYENPKEIIKSIMSSRSRKTKFLLFLRRVQEEIEGISKLYLPRKQDHIKEIRKMAKQPGGCSMCNVYTPWELYHAMISKLVDMYLDYGDRGSDSYNHLWFFEVIETLNLNHYSFIGKDPDNGSFSRVWIHGKLTYTKGKKSALQ